MLVDMSCGETYKLQLSNNIRMCEGTLVDNLAFSVWYSGVRL